MSKQGLEYGHGPLPSKPAGGFFQDLRIDMQALIGCMSYPLYKQMRDADCHIALSLQACSAEKRPSDFCTSCFTTQQLCKASNMRVLKVMRCPSCAPTSSTQSNEVLQQRCES